MRGIIIKTVFSVLIAAMAAPIYGDEDWKDEPPPFRERVFFGGNFGFTFGNATSIIISPLAGYHITPRLAGGLGLRYEYLKYNYPGVLTFDTHIYGGSAFARYMLIDDMAKDIGIGPEKGGLFAQAEYEPLSVENWYHDPANPVSDERIILHSVLVGGGIYQPIGRRTGLLISVLWNLNESYNSIYSNPVIRLGITF